jgi:hypothetical protein
MRPAALVVAVGLALVLAGTAGADGDPASDYLLVQNYFLPLPPPGNDAADALRREIARVYAKGQRVKVAVIATPTDLGAVPSLFGKPTEYAKFLGQELVFYYVGPLLIVMPSGYGIYDGGRSTAAEERVLEKLEPAGASPDDLAHAAADAVGKLLDANALRSRDVRAPYANVIAGQGRRGRRVRLSYDVADDSGRSEVVIRVKTPTRVLATFHQAARGISALKRFSVVWKVPRRGSLANLQFCVTAKDPAGNRNRPACAGIGVT